MFSGYAAWVGFFVSGCGSRRTGTLFHRAFRAKPKLNDADGRAETYPEIVPKTFEAMGKAFEGMFVDQNVPTNPIDVVNTFASLADSEAGTRPFRSVVGVDIGVIARNESDELHEGTFLEAMGLTDFARLKS